MAALGIWIIGMVEYDYKDEIQDIKAEIDFNLSKRETLIYEDVCYGEKAVKLENIKEIEGLLEKMIK